MIKTANRYLTDRTHLFYNTGAQRNYLKPCLAFLGCAGISTLAWKWNQPQFRPSLYLATKLFIATHNPYNTLYMEKVSSENWDTLMETLILWEKIAAQKIKEARKETNDFEVFTDSYYIAQYIRALMCRPHADGSFYICRDTHSKIQGVLCLKHCNKQKQIEISGVMTHPHNIRSSLNEKEEYRIRGVGTRCMLFALQEALKRDALHIQGGSVTSAKSFYRKTAAANHLHYYHKDKYENAIDIPSELISIYKTLCKSEKIDEGK